MSSSTAGPSTVGVASPLVNPISEVLSFYVTGTALPSQVYNPQSTGDAGNGELVGINELARLIIASTLAAMISRLDELSALPPDWDSYGSEPPSAAALNVARGIMRSLAEDPSISDECVPFFAGPLSGGVQLEWRSQSGVAVEMEIDAEGRSDCLIARGTVPNRSFEERKGVSTAEVLELVRSIAQ